MSPVSGIGNPLPIQPPYGSGHGDHGFSAVNPNTDVGQSFSTVLAQAIGQAPGIGAHANHGGVGGPDSTHTPHFGSHPNFPSASNGGPHLQHFPIGGSSHDGDHGFQETALGLRAYRQQLIASNIANADTPGYKAVDIDFQEALRIAQYAVNAMPLALSNTASGHISGQAQSAAPSYPLKYSIPSQPSADGNTVEMDVERAKFAENTVMWEFSRDRVSSHFKMLMEMLQNLRD